MMDEKMNESTKQCVKRLICAVNDLLVPYNATISMPTRVSNGIQDAYHQLVNALDFDIYVTVQEYWEEWREFIPRGLQHTSMASDPTEFTHVVKKTEGFYCTAYDKQTRSYLLKSLADNDAIIVHIGRVAN